jgi:hypothetical protein
MLRTYASNVLTATIYEQVEEDGNAYTLLESIVDHKKSDNALEHEDSKIVENGKIHPKRTKKV